MIIEDQYYYRSEISNSDLSWLKQQLSGKDAYNPTDAYRFGNLIDLMITEPERVSPDFCQNYPVPTEIITAQKMYSAFMSDKFCREMREQSIGQKVMIARQYMIGYDGVEFALPARCKWDLWSDALGCGGDIKSTSATTQAQFEAAVKHFDYDRQRAWYMNIANSNEDVIIGISKKAPHNIFKVFIKRNSQIFNDGVAKYTDLAYRWWCMFGETNPNQRKYE